MCGERARADVATFIVGDASSNVAQAIRSSALWQSRLPMPRGRPAPVSRKRKVLLIARHGPARLEGLHPPG